MAKLELRGGSWFEASSMNASLSAYGLSRFSGYTDVGFRCMRRALSLLGPSGGSVWAHGGSGLSKPAWTRARNRRGGTPTSRIPSDGFRCVRNAS